MLIDNQFIKRSGVMGRVLHVFFILGTLITALLLSGCSVKMAASTKNNQRLGVLAVGQDRYFVDCRF